MIFNLIDYQTFDLYLSIRWYLTITNNKTCLAMRGALPAPSCVTWGVRSIIELDRPGHLDLSLTSCCFAFAAPPRLLKVMMSRGQMIPKEIT